MAATTATSPTPNIEVSPQSGLELLKANLEESDLANRTMRALDTQRVADFTVSSAQLLDAFNTPVTLITAPGAGKTLVLEKVFISYIAGSVAYTVGGAGAYYIKYTNAAGTSVAAFPATGIVDQSSNIVAVANALPAPAAGIVVTANAALVFGQLTAACTAGNGTLNLRLVYSVMPSVF